MDDGVLNQDYARQRLNKKYLDFRYKLRARVAAFIIGQHNNNESFQLVDFGAAEGLALLEIHNILRRGHYVGVEFSQELIDSAPELPQNIKLIQGDVSNLNNFSNNSANFITALAVLEHLHDPVKAFKEAERILKPGGIFIATSPVPLWDKIVDKIKLGQQFSGEESHLCDMNKRQFQHLSLKANLSPLGYFKFMFAPVGFLPYLKIKPNIKLALTLDRALNRLVFLDWLFVNQCFIAKKT